MKEEVLIPPMRRIMCALIRTCLSILLLLLVLLGWLTNLDQPARIPDFITDRVVSLLAKGGLHLQARNFWIQPHLVIAVDDMSLSVEGLSGEIVEAARMEISLHPAQLLAGRFTVTQFRLSGGRIWCPASVAQDGIRKQLANECAIDLEQERPWYHLRNAQARNGAVTCQIVGQLPSKFLQADDKVRTSIPIAQRVSKALSVLDNAIQFAHRTGGAMISARCSGRMDGSAELSLTALFGDNWHDAKVGLVEVRSARFDGIASIGVDGHLANWRVTAATQGIAWGGWSAERAHLLVQGSGLESGTVELSFAKVNGFGLSLPRVSLRGEKFLSLKEYIDFRLCSNATWATGKLLIDLKGPLELQVKSATLAVADLYAIPSVGKLLRQAPIKLGNEILLRDVVAKLTPQGAVQHASGEMALSGLEAHGLSASAISPERDLPMRTWFSYDAAREKAPLHLRELRLASVSGEADLQIQAGGAYRIALYGEVAPAALDDVLGDWWVALWRNFTLAQRPHAFIEVNGHWGKFGTVTRGRVLLRRFEFLGAPFRRVEVSIDANRQRTSIGIHGLAGGASDSDGSVDGTAIWDWSKPPAMEGPVVRLQGDIHPWIAARCGGQEAGESLRRLELPSARRLKIELSPLGKTLQYQAELACEGPFTAWGIRGNGLQAEVSSLPKGMRIGAKMGVAGGKGQLSLEGDTKQPMKVDLTLEKCDPLSVGNLFAGEKNLTYTKSANLVRGDLDLTFKGEVVLSDLKTARGLGRYNLNEPELRKVRLFGEISRILEGIGIEATTYELTQAQGSFGCLGARAYFPDMNITGPQAKLSLKGEIDLQASNLEFEGDFALPRKGGFNPLNLININRALVSLVKIKLDGSISTPKTRIIPSIEYFISTSDDNHLGDIPASLLE